MRHAIILFIILIAFAHSLSIGDQIVLYVREGGNQTSQRFYALGTSFHMLFINCIPVAILEESDGNLAAVDASRVEDLVGEYIRRGYMGCDNETMSLNASTLAIVTQAYSRQLESDGKRAAIEREDELRLLHDRWIGLEQKAHAYSDVEFVVVEQKFERLYEILLNLRRVKSRTAIDRLSSDFDLAFFETKSLVDEYEAALPHYLSAAAALSNTSLALKNAKKLYGEEDPWLKSLDHSFFALEADMTVNEKDLSAGIMPPIESYSQIILRAKEIRGKTGQRGPQLPAYYIYSLVALCAAILAIAVFLRLRPPKKIQEDDVPKIRKLLAKLRVIEEKEESGE
ncbi:MAG: hypothetical protein ABH863_02045 [Candidatus Micrarchaeota archaeon]